jgi:hypothetical protein
MKLQGIILKFPAFGTTSREVIAELSKWHLPGNDDSVAKQCASFSGRFRITHPRTG